MLNAARQQQRFQPTNAIPWELVLGMLRIRAWGFPKIRGTFSGVPIIRIIVFGDLYWVPLFRETTSSGLGLEVCNSGFLSIRVCEDFAVWMA